MPLRGKVDSPTRSRGSDGRRLACAANHGDAVEGARLRRDDLLVEEGRDALHVLQGRAERRRQAWWCCGGRCHGSCLGTVPTRPRGAWDTQLDAGVRTSRPAPIASLSSRFAVTPRRTSCP